MAGECEICGSGGAYYEVLIEGARLSVCGKCSKHGKIVSSPPPIRTERKVETKSSEMDIVADFGARIKGAREKMRIGRDVLAEMVNEKESFIDRIEKEETIPTQALAVKLEKILGITLFEQIKYGETEGKKKGANLTLGDVVVIKKK